MGSDLLVRGARGRFMCAGAVAVALAGFGASAYAAPATMPVADGHPGALVAEERALGVAENAAVAGMRGEFRADAERALGDLAHRRVERVGAILALVRSGDVTPARAAGWIGRDMARHARIARVLVDARAPGARDVAAGRERARRALVGAARAGMSAPAMRAAARAALSQVAPRARRPSHHGFGPRVAKAPSPADGALNVQRAHRR